MLLSTDAWADPRIVELTDRECWTFIKAFSYSSMWNLPRLTRRQLRFVGVTAKTARRFAEVQIALLEEDGSLTWTCGDLARFTPRDRTTSSLDRGAGYTYLIQAGETGAIKIGSTYKDPEERLRALQTGSSEPLRLVKVIDGAHLERELHARYARFRTRGEWFDPQILTVFE